MRSPQHLSQPKSRDASPHAPMPQGEPLEAGLRAALEPQFGHSFADVRVHSDAAAAERSSALEANAFAVGTDVFFAAERYRPQTPEGLHLLAHELTHVVQESQFGRGQPGLSHASDASEREASRNADAALTGGSVSVQSAPSASVSRDQAGSSPLDNPIFKGVMTAAGFIPGIGGGIAKIMNTGFNGARAAQDAQNGNGLGSFRNGMGAVGSFMGGIAALDGFSTLAALGAPASSAVTGLGATGVGVTGAASGATLGSAGAALGPAAAVIGAGLGGMAIGDALANHTSVGQHSEGSVGGVDRFLTNHLLGEGSRSMTLQLDEMRQDEWDKTTLNPLTWGHGLLSAGALVDEAAIGTAGAIGGLAGGAADAVSWAGNGISNAASGAYHWLDNGVRSIYGL